MTLTNQMAVPCARGKRLDATSQPLLHKVRRSARAHRLKQYERYSINWVNIKDNQRHQAMMTTSPMTWVLLVAASHRGFHDMSFCTVAIPCLNSAHAPTWLHTIFLGEGHHLHPEVRTDTVASNGRLCLNHCDCFTQMNSSSSGSRPCEVATDHACMTGPRY